MLRRLADFASAHKSLTIGLALVSPVLAFYAPLLLGVRTFPSGDFTHHFLPFSIFQRNALRALNLPLWNPYTYGGHPFLADTQAAVYYPLSNLLLMLTLPFAGEASRLYLLQVEAILQSVLAGLFVYLLVRDISRSRWGALLAGVTFALSGYLVSYPPLQLAVLRTILWLPLVLWLLYRSAAARPPWLWAAGVGPVLAVAVTAGHPQTLLYVAYVALAWGVLLVALLWRDRGPGDAASCALAFVLAAGIGVALSAAQWLPSLEFTRLSVRASVDYAYVSGGFPLQDTWQLLLPGTLTYYSPLYIGVVSLALTCVALVAAPAAGKGGGPAWSGAATFFFLVAGLLFLLVSYGGNSFLYPIVYRWLPGWNAFRGQERAAAIVALSLSTLAGLGAAAAPGLKLSARRKTALAYGAVVVGATYAFGLMWQLGGRTAISDVRFLMIATFTLLFAVAACLLLWWPEWSSRRSILFLALSTLNLFVFGFGLNLAAGSPSEAVAPAPEITALQAAVSTTSAANLGLPDRVYNEYRVYEDYGMNARVEDLWGSSPLRLADYSSLNVDFPLDRWWRLFGVAQVLTWRKDLFLPSTAVAEFPQQSDTTYLHSLSNPFPRAWFVTATQVADDARAHALLADHNFDLDQKVILPLETGLADTQLPQAMAEIRLERVDAETIHVQVESDGPGILVVAENWMPGWQVRELIPPPGAPETVLGLPTWKPVRANLTEIAIPIAAGSSAFDLTYAPDTVRNGIWISTIAVVVVLAALFFLAKRRMTPRP
jgi:hypothetical protein